MKYVWTKRGTKRLQSAFDYIADNFYLDYAIHFNEAAKETAVAGRHGRGTSPPGENNHANYTILASILSTASGRSRS